MSKVDQISGEVQESGEGNEYLQHQGNSGEAVSHPKPPPTTPRREDRHDGHKKVHISRPKKAKVVESEAAEDDANISCLDRPVFIITAAVILAVIFCTSPFWLLESLKWIFNTIVNNITG